MEKQNILKYLCNTNPEFEFLLQNDSVYRVFTLGATIHNKMGMRMNIYDFVLSPAHLNVTDKYEEVSNVLSNALEPLCEI